MIYLKPYLRNLKDLCETNIKLKGHREEVFDQKKIKTIKLIVFVRGGRGKMFPRRVGLKMFWAFGPTI